MILHSKIKISFKRHGAALSPQVAITYSCCVSYGQECYEGGHMQQQKNN